jgi:N-acetylmuramoyl-L-alanine amidase
MKKTFLVLLVAVYSLAIFTPVAVFAQDTSVEETTQDLIRRDINYYDPGINDQCTTNSSDPNNVSNNKVFLIGDSYSVGIDSTITKDLKNANYQVTGRSLDNAGTITSNGGDGGTPALDALDKYKDKITDAGSMVVLLGTNPGDYENDIPKFAEKLKNINDQITVYWMTVGYRKAPDGDLKTRNEIITKKANESGYKIVDWNSVYQNNKSLISGDNVHPTDEGYKKLSDLFLQSMGKYSPGSKSSTTPPTKFMTTNENQSNKKRFWTFLTSPNGLGLPPIGAAAVMGNIQQESGFNPKAVNPSSGATGLAQWLGSRKTNLDNFRQNHKNDGDEMDIQLNFLKKEVVEDYKFMLKLLKEEQDIVTATVIFHGSNSNFTVPELKGNLGFERSGDSLDTIKSVRGGNAKQIYKEFKGQDPSSGLSNNSNSQKCLCTETKAEKPIVYLDPGHSGKDINKIDQQTNIRDHDYPNFPEIFDVWEVSQITKEKLEKDGYEVVLSKDKAEETSSLRSKASKADNSNADIAISIHTDPDLPNTGWITIPKVDQYRISENNKKVKYNSGATAEKSLKHSESFLANRKESEGNDIVMKDLNFENRPGLAGGDIPLIMLFSDTPWIYLEKKSSDSGLSKKQKDDYAESIYKSITSSLPISNNTSQAVEGCKTGSSEESGSILDKVTEYAWEDGRKVGSNSGGAKDAYKDASEKAKKDGKYVGFLSGNPGNYTDCGAFITRVMQNSVDGSYGGGGNTYTQEKYLKDSKKYQALGAVNNTTKLQPGDIGVVNQGDGNGASGHIFMYTGKINSKWSKNGASASQEQYVPTNVDVYFNDDRGNYSWFRYIGE